MMESSEDLKVRCESCDHDVFAAPGLLVQYYSFVYILNFK